MLVDHSGFPSRWGAGEENHAETKAIVPMVQQFLDAHGLDPADLVVVADAGMLSYTNLAALDEAGCSFIVGSKTTKAPYDLAEHTHFHGDAYSDGQLIETTTPKRGARSAPARARVQGTGPPGTRQGRLLVAGGVALLRQAVHPRQPDTHRPGEQGPGRHRRGQSRHRPRFVTGRRRPEPGRDRPEQGSRSGAGLKGYVTNMTTARMGPPRSWRPTRTWHVRQSWRMSKHDLRARPVFHHQREAIEAHLTMVMTALALARYLQDTTGMSIQRIIHALKPIRTAGIHLGGHTITASHPITPSQTILDALNIQP